MKTLAPTRSSRQNWLNNPILSGPYKSWLIDKGSLTKRLQVFANAHGDSFSVMPKQLVDMAPCWDEVQVMGVPSRQYTLQRDVVLFSGVNAVVFAHSVLPYASLRGQWRVLSKLGKRPLGAVLFSDPKVKRTALSYKKLSKQHPLYIKAAASLDCAPDVLWARRSVFSLNCAKILVTEVFLLPLLDK